MRSIALRSGIETTEQKEEVLDDVLEELNAMEIVPRQLLKNSYPLLKLEMKGFDLSKLGSPEVFNGLMDDLYQSGELRSLIYFGMIDCNLSSQISPTSSDSCFTQLLMSSPSLLELQLGSNRLSFEHLQTILTDLLGHRF